MDGLNDIDEYFKQMFLTYTFESVMQDDDVVRHHHPVAAKAAQTNF
jgi:hypothetical protein